MYEIDYEHDMDSSRVVCTVDKECKRNQYEVCMLQNKIDGVLPFAIREKDGELQYTYDCTGYSALSTYIVNKKLSIEIISLLLNELIRIVRSAKAFLLQENNFIIQIDRIYTSGGSTFALMYYPGYDGDIREQLEQLVEEFMKLIDYNERELVQYVYYLYRIIHEKDCTFEQLAEASKTVHICDTFSESIGSKGKKEEIDSGEDDQMKREIPVMADQLVQEEEKTYFPILCYVKLFILLLVCVFLFVCFCRCKVYTDSDGQNNAIKFICGIVIILTSFLYIVSKIFNRSNQSVRMCTNTSYITYQNSLIKNVDSKKKDLISQAFHKKQINHLSYDNIEHQNKEVYLNKESTVCLEKDTTDKKSEYSEEEPTMLLSKGGIHLLLRSNTYGDFMVKEECVLGSSTKNTDYIIGNQTVSRRHARIIKKEDMFYITDLNSTNGTYVNQCFVRATEYMPLHHGDEIMLSDEKFQVELSSDAE